MMKNGCACSNTEFLLGIISRKQLNLTLTVLTNVSTAIRGESTALARVLCRIGAAAQTEKLLLLGMRTKLRVLSLPCQKIMRDPPAR